jgi:hypothetical protein
MPPSPSGRANPTKVPDTAKLLPDLTPVPMPYGWFDLLSGPPWPSLHLLGILRALPNELPWTNGSQLPLCIGPYPPFSARYLSCTSQGCTLQEMSHTTPGDNPTISRYHRTQVTVNTAPNHRIRSLKASVIISKIFLFTVRKLKHSLFLSKSRHILITVWSGSPTELRNHFKPTLIFNVLSFNDGPNMIL